jgi:hypothetical protein
MITRENYYEKVKKFASEYGENPSIHIIDIMASVMMTRDNYMMGGSFVQSVVNNDLYGAINRADKECLANLKLIVATKHNCYLNQ